MTTPGVDEIAARFHQDGAGAAVSGTLEIALGRIASSLAKQDRRRDELAGAVSYIPGIPIPQLKTAVLPYVTGAGFGPTPGYTWAIQSMRAEGLGTSDLLNLYRGTNPAAVNGGNGLHSFTVAAANAISEWSPGRTAILLAGTNLAGLVFNGTIGGTVTVTLDVIQVADAQLAYFLL